MSIVVCKLPKAGLGNQLFPLTKALVFAHINKLPLIIINYHQVKIGPYLRKEKNKRRYNGFFKFQKNIAAAQLDKWKLIRYKNYRHVTEPPLKIADASAGEKILYLFSAMPHWNNYFEGLKQHRKLAADLLHQQIIQPVLTKLAGMQAPQIGVHIRMGDFRKLQSGENFAKVGAVRTPENYFINIIKSARQINGSSLPVTVFTDGYKNELPGIFDLDNVTLSEGNNDLLDLLLLSRSKIIVTSAGSTFSYWAGFLSDAPLIMHPDHIHESIRPEAVQTSFYEGAFDTSNELLITAIKNTR